MFLNKFSAEFHNDHPFSKEEMWHPHLKKLSNDKNFEISDEMNKIYPIQLLQLKTSMLKGKTTPKMSCGCKFINTITTTPSLIQMRQPAPQSISIINKVSLKKRLTFTPIISVM